MTMKDELVRQLETALKSGREIADRADQEKRDFTAEERATLVQTVENAKQARKGLDDLKADAELRASMAAMGEGIGLSMNPDPGGGDPPSRSSGAPGKGRTVGEQFVNSPQYKELMSRFPNGEIPEKARVQSDPVSFKQLITVGDPFGDPADRSSAGVFVRPDFTGILDLLGRPPLTVRNLVSVRTTTSDIVWFARQISRVNAAAVVPEATQTSGASGTKPEGGFDFEQVAERVKTIAEWVPATKRALSDAAQLRGIIDQELRGDLAEAEEDEILNGDGSGEHFTGLEHTEGTQAQGFDTDLLVTTRKAITLIRWVGLSTPSAFLFNPEDDESIDLLRDGQGRFFGNGPFAMGPQTLWGLPRVVSTRVPSGQAWLGDWRRAVIWDREQASISVSDSHADFFIRNLIAVLGEQREAFGVIRPVAFVRISTAGA